MKRNLFFATVALGMSGALFVASTVRADDETKPAPPPSFDKGAPEKGTSVIGGQSQKFVKGSQLTTASIKSSSGETLGQINDLVVDPATGRIEFAVISPTGSTEPGKLTAVPWTLIRASGSGPMVNLTANIDKEKLNSAQKFDRFQWPDMSQENWAQQVYSHYGLQWQDRTSAGGRVGIGGSEVGTGVSPDSSKDADNGTAPDGKGTLRPDNQNRPGTLPDNTIPGKKDSDLK